MACADEDDFDDECTITVKEWRAHVWIESDGSGPDVCVCKEWEMQCCQFWGRLLVAADKYCIDDLAALCAEHMIDRIGVWSASTMLHLACSANQHALKRDIMNFMTLTKQLFSDVRETPEFDLLDPDLRDELTDVFVQEQGNMANTKKCQQIHCNEFPAVLMMSRRLRSVPSPWLYFFTWRCTLAATCITALTPHSIARQRTQSSNQLLSAISQGW